MQTYIELMRELTEMKKVGMSVPKKLLNMTEIQFKKWTEDYDGMNSTETADLLIQVAKYL